MEKELYRVKEGKWIAGVCTGMAKYMNLTPAMVRCIFVLMVFLAFGAGIFVYIASIFMIQWEPEAYVELPEEEAMEELPEGSVEKIEAKEE